MYDLGGESALGGNGGAGAGFGFSDIFEPFFGAAAGGTSRGPTPRGRRGQDALIRLDIDLRDAVFGVDEEVQVDTAVLCGTCNGTCTRPGTSVQTCVVRSEERRVGKECKSQWWQ